MKLSFLILFFLALSGAGESEEPTNPKETKPQSKTTELDKKKPAQQRAPSDFVPPKPPIDKYPPDKQASEKKNQPWQPTDWFNLWLVIFTGCLVGVGIAQAIIYRKQAKYMRRGLKLTRKAANAAKESADTAVHQFNLIASHERPWLIVNPDKIPDWVISKQYPFGGPVEWSAKNVGRTPAFLTELAVMADIIPLPVPDQRPSYPQPKPFAKFIIPPNGTHSSRTGDPMDASKLRSLFNGTHCLIIYGRIAYRDSLDDQHVTRFCCYWHLENGQWLYEPVGPPDWVDYT